MIDINAWLPRQFPNPPCWSLVAAFYAEEMAQSVTDFKTIDAGIRGIASAFRLQLSKGAHGFGQIADPVDCCVVLLGKSEQLGFHHCGIYYGGKLLHALASGNYYEDMSGIQDTYPLIQYWAKA